MRAGLLFSGAWVLAFVAGIWTGAGLERRANAGLERRASAEREVWNKRGLIRWECPWSGPGPTIITIGDDSCETTIMNIDFDGNGSGMLLHATVMGTP